MSRLVYVALCLPLVAEGWLIRPTLRCPQSQSMWNGVCYPNPACASGLTWCGWQWGCRQLPPGVVYGAAARAPASSPGGYGSSEQTWQVEVGVEPQGQLAGEVDMGDGANSYVPAQGWCAAGYTWNGRECEDVNECRTGAHSCNMNASCRNQLGSYMCKCGEGYRGDGYTCVLDSTLAEP